VRNTLDFEFSLKNVALLQPNPDFLESCYLESLLNHFFFKQDLLRRSSKGGAQKFISLKVLRSAQAPIPPLDLQQRFAAIVESVEQQKTRMQAHLDELDTLFASLQSRAFNGELE
jgi:type I restriction enzyme S subunit